MNEERNKRQTIEAPVAEAIIFTHERRQQITQRLEQQQRVTVAELVQQFAVSEVTIRKDLAWLESQQIAVRTHGGAIIASTRLNSSEMGLEVRELLQTSEKTRIGEAAASYIQSGETIALDASTTALAMAPFLGAKHELTVMTNGLRTAMALNNSSNNISVLIPGGMLRQKSFSLVGTWGKSILQNIHISKAFVGARGLTINEGLTDVNGDEVELKREIVAAAKEVIAIIDSSKWDQVAFATFCPLERLKLIITDTQAPDKMVQQIRQLGIEVLLV
jgi:DeoR/GlpR family transcriptional regulator of sugar metabolism